MVKDINIITDYSLIDKMQWREFVFNHPFGNYFQSHLTYEFFSSVKKYQPLIIAAIIDGKIVGSLLCVFIRENNGLKGFLSRRCIVWGGPLVSNNNTDISFVLLKKLNEISSRRSIYVEFRNMFDLSCYSDIFLQSGYLFYPHLNYIIHISSLEHIWIIVSDSKKRQIKKSLNNGASIIEADDINQVKDYYNILKKLYKEKVKKPLPDLEYFIEFFKNKDYGIYLLVKYQNDIIGGIMCPIYRDTIYELYICGLDNVYKNIYPSVLATWSPIEYAAKNGLRCFDFLGAGKPDEDYGVREFKSKFGGELVNYGRFVKINNKILYNLGKTSLKVLTKIR
jgi:serine/alanine adding enzyme